MKVRILPFVLRTIVRLYPCAWRKRYEDEVLELVGRPHPRWRDVFDLIRSAGSEWRYRLARSLGSRLRVVATAYLLMVVIWTVSVMASEFIKIVRPPYGFHPNFRFLYEVPVTTAIFGVPVLLIALAVNVPLLVLLWLVRRRISVPFARFVLAAGVVTWGEWMLYKMEYYDTWRHGIPGVRYWLAVPLPWGAALASAGAIIGGALVRDRENRAASMEAVREA